jgi:hypothetical protein
LKEQQSSANLYYLFNIAPVGTKERTKEMVLFGGKDMNFILKQDKIQVFLMDKKYFYYFCRQFLNIG